MSSRNLNLKLKKLTGSTPAELIRNMRLKKAVELLKSTNYTTSEIAYHTGFSHSSNFIRVFKQKFGTTPQEYLKR